MNETQQWDVVIVGAGPAGLAAGLYAARDRFKTLLIEKNGLPGGQIMLTEHIENYPGYEKIGGFELVEQFKKQATEFGAEIVCSQAVTNLEKTDDGLIRVTVNKGQAEYLARAVILAPGSEYRQLGLPGEAELRLAGKVSYCATCDGAFYRDKHVLTIGGGNTAVEDTVYLASRFAGKVTMIHRRTEFRAQAVLVEELYEKAKEHNIDVKLPYVADALVPTEDGTEIDHVLLRNVETDETEKLTVDGVFIFAGMVPNTDWLDGLISRDHSGYIPGDPTTMKTALPGVFVAGDCRQNAPMQLATATADGVTAAMQVRDYFRDPSHWCDPQTPCEPKGW